ncbi:MAG: phosphoribosylformylglycinamidine synthase subunit PurQ [Saprospiraceae bacterium]|nr:phosphoribosylformylglycinamidine synthase subunit PurQ [Saprospiraceae bacterium]
MDFGVVVFPGSNCDHDMMHVLQELNSGKVHALWHKETKLPDLTVGDCIVLPGGFSYGDYLRAGAIARFSPIMQSVVDFAAAGGMVVGICNGFQILCEANLLPGVLLRNANQKFICKNVFVTPQHRRTAMTSSLEQRAYKIPIAHAEGRYHCSSETLAELVSNDQIMFRYTSAAGKPDSQSNPNGSLDDIAGICNKSGNVMGMMPHPERAADPALLNEDGAAFFASMLTHQAEKIAAAY